MKKIFVTIMAAFAACLAGNAQVTFSPGTFTAEDQVTLTVDVTGSRGGAMENAAEAYIWIFANPGGRGTTKDGRVNTSWSNSPVEAKMTKVSGNKWSYTFTGTNMLQLTPGELFDFGFLVKTKDGSKQTDDFKSFKFDPLIFTPGMLRIFPSKVGRDDVVTMNFERSLGATVSEQRMTPDSAVVTMYDDAGNQVGTPKAFTVRKTAENIWSASFIPTMSFTAPTGKKLQRFTYRFYGRVLGTTGAPQTVNTTDASVEFTEMK